MKDRHSEALSQASARLGKRYPMLHTYEGTTAGSCGKPFLHLWKPVSSQGLCQGLTFLPTFSAVLTAEQNEEGFDTFAMALLSFHGKIVSGQKFNMDPESLDDTKLEILDDLATDSIHVCQGVQEVQESRWKQYLGGKAAKATPVLERVTSVFFVEPFQDEVVLRSRQCKYFVRNPVRNDSPEAVDYIRCEACSVFQKKRPVSLFTYRKHDQEQPPDDDGECLADLCELVDNEFAGVAEQVHAEERVKAQELRDFRNFSKHIVKHDDAEEEMVVEPEMNYDAFKTEESDEEEDKDDIYLPPPPSSTAKRKRQPAASKKKPAKPKTKTRDCGHCQSAS